MASRQNGRRVFANLWRAVWRHRGRTLAAVVLLVAAKGAAVGVPLLLKAVVDRLGGTASSLQPLVLPVFLLIAYALLRFAGTLFTELRDLVFARVTLRTVRDFAERTFGHLMSLSPRFHVQRNTGSLIRDVERGTTGIGFLLGAGLFTVLPTLVEFAAVLGIMAAGYSGWFTVVILATFVVYATYTTTMTARRSLRQRRVNEIDSTANGRMVDSLINYETVKTYAREDFERGRYGGVLDQWVAHSVKNQQALSALHLGQSAIIAVGVAAVMLLAGQQTVRGAMTVGDLVLVNAYLIQICLPLNALGFVFREARDALVNTEKLFGLLAQKPEVQEGSANPPLAVRGGEVVFDHVDFGYEAGRRILQEVSFTLPAGRTVAVVGGSGSGKSTLARLLLRLYDVQGGRITVDGQDVRAVQVATLREAIGVVPQDTVLFNDTIAYNIGYGRAGASREEVEQAARAAQVHEFILSLPEQYDTVVGERGLKLSGGEKQRIAIARAFLKNPPLMIFDEATSALDTRAERAIQGELDRIAQGRSTLIIAHRLSTIVNADRIIVMDKGRIVEQGRHDELLQRKGLYAQLWNLQRQQQQVEQLQSELARQPTNLAVLLAGVLDALRGAFESRRVALYTEIDPEPARVTCDPSALAQLVRELLIAALHVTPPGGRIALQLARDDAHARLAIVDGRRAPASPAPVLAAVQGVPVAPPAVQPRREGDLPPDPLALRAVLERQGGALEVEPASVAHGLRYTVVLPLATVDMEAFPPRVAGRLGEDDAAGAAPPSDALAGLRVACVDDRRDTLEALRHQLESEGAHVMPYASARECIAALERQPREAWPQVLVSDIALGDEDGHQVVRRMRQLEAERGVPLDRRVPAIALTGLSQAGDRVRALMAGFQVHLAKPVDPQELVAAIYALSGRAAQALATGAGDAAPADDDAATTPFTSRRPA